MSKKHSGKSNVSIGFFSKMNTKLIILAFIVIVSASILEIVFAVHSSVDSTISTYQNYITNLAEATATSLNSMENFSSKTLSSEEYGHFLKDVEISGIEDSYAYIAGIDGKIIWHPDQAMIGRPVPSETIASVIKEANFGGLRDSGYTEETINGQKTLSGYAFTQRSGIVVISGNLLNMISPAFKMRNKLIVIAIATTASLIIVTAIISIIMFQGLSTIVPVIDKTADLDFSSSKEVERLTKRKDEVGAIARSLVKMQTSLQDVVESINNAGISVDTNVDELKSTIENVEHICQDNSATTQELAAGMQETAATTTLISRTVENVKTNAENIECLADEGNEMSLQVLERARKLAEVTEKAGRDTIDIFETVKKKTVNALDASDAVTKINDLTETIMTISSQTRLLSLNASIEAARAGEEGKGFAVVASEISSLATQTEEAIKNINDTVEEVNDAVALLSDCLEEMTEFLEKKVFNDYKEFGKVSDQYRNDADVFGDSMNTIKNSIVALNLEIDNIVNAITGIDGNITDASSGVTNIAEKTSDMAEEATGSNEKVLQCKAAVSKLKGIISKIKL